MAVIAWDASTVQFTIDNNPADLVVVKGVADTARQESRAQMFQAGEQLQAGEIDLPEWYRTMKRASKLLHMSEYSLGRGGWAQMTDGHWDTVEAIVLDKWAGVPGVYPGLRSFGEDVQRGRYGDKVQSSDFLRRVGMYADDGHSTFENSRLQARSEGGHVVARRIRAAVDSCADCRAWAALGWIPIREMMERYYIGASRCGGRCYCTIITSRQSETNDDFGEGFTKVDVMPEDLAGALELTDSAPLSLVSPSVARLAFGNAPSRRLPAPNRALPSSTRSLPSGGRRVPRALPGPRTFTL